jgi:hypothetical protein
VAFSFFFYVTVVSVWSCLSVFVSVCVCVGGVWVFLRVSVCSVGGCWFVTTTTTTALYLCVVRCRSRMYA